jgi:hypothetical protein
MLDAAPRRIMAVLVAAGIAATTTACGTTINSYSHTVGSAPYTDGSGKTRTETRTLALFHTLSVESGIEAVISIGSESSVAVTADDNLVALITTRVQDGSLTISVDGSLRTNHPLKVAVATPGLDLVVVSNGATLDFENATAAGPLVIQVSSGATVRAGGTVASLALAATNGSTADLRNLSTQQATVKLDNGSTAHVRSSGTVDGYCHGGSTLFIGSAAQNKVESDVSSTVKTE